LTDQAKRILRRAIVDGEYPPGTRLVETSLAEVYGVTRHIMRYALQALEGEGLVQSDPFRGRSVAVLGVHDYSCTYLIRIALEALAAGLAAFRITSEQFAALADRGRLSADPSEFSDIVEWDIALHREIWRIANEPVLTGQLEKLIWPLMVMKRTVLGEDQAELIKLQIEREGNDHPQGHGPLLRAICTRNPKEAHAAMVAHLYPFGAAEMSLEAAHVVTTIFGIKGPGES
jgi:DNA-binding GntR family transcriptional regulator